MKINLSKQNNKEVERYKIECAKAHCIFLQEGLDDYKQNIDSSNLIKHSIECLNKLLEDIIKED